MKFQFMTASHGDIDSWDEDMNQIVDYEDEVWITTVDLIPKEEAIRIKKILEELTKDIHITKEGDGN